MQALSLKPAILAEAMTHPGWIVEYFKRGGGTPMLGNWQPYAPAGADAEEVDKFSSLSAPFNAQTWKRPRDSTASCSRATSSSRAS